MRITDLDEPPRFHGLRKRFYPHSWWERYTRKVTAAYQAERLRRERSEDPETRGYDLALRADTAEADTMRLRELREGTPHSSRCRCEACRGRRADSQKMKDLARRARDRVMDDCYICDGHHDCHICADYNDSHSGSHQERESDNSAGFERSKEVARKMMQTVICPLCKRRAPEHSPTCLGNPPASHSDDPDCKCRSCRIADEVAADRRASEVPVPGFYDGQEGARAKTCRCGIPVGDLERSGFCRLCGGLVKAGDSHTAKPVPAY